MKVFLSWSEGDSEKAASLLRKYFGLVFDHVKVFFSPQDIRSGQWSPQLLKELRESDFGIFCVTRENLDSPWMHFEAGAIAAGRDSEKVIAFLLIGVRDRELKGPYSLYQQKNFDRVGLHSVFWDIYELLGKPFEENLFEIKLNAFLREISGTDEWIQVMEVVKSPRLSEEEDQLQKIVQEIKELVERKLNTKYLGEFPGFFKDICDCAATASEEFFVCCDYVTYGQYTSPKVRASDFEKYIGGVGLEPDAAGLVFAYDVYREIIKFKHYQEKTKTRFVVYGDDLRRSNNEEQVRADFEKSKHTWRERTGESVETVEDLLERLDASQTSKRDEDFGFLDNYIVRTNNTMPIYAWVADKGRAVFAIPDSSNNAMEHGFETTDDRLIKAIKSVILRYQTPSNLAARPLGLMPKPGGDE